MYNYRYIPTIQNGYNVQNAGASTVGSMSRAVSLSPSTTYYQEVVAYDWNPSTGTWIEEDYPQII